jgi:Icc protein
MRSLRLLQFTDTHLVADPAGRLRGAATLPRLQACIAHAQRHFFRPDAVALTGDLVHDEAAAYGMLELLFDPLGVPVLLIPGNHDVPAEMRRRLASPPFQIGGLFFADPWTVVLLETWYAESAHGEGRLGDDQQRALDATLEQHRDDPVFVFLHHPPIRMDSATLDELRLQDGAELLQLLHRHPQVRGVAWGHAHQSLDIFCAGYPRLMCTPATCMQFRPRCDDIVVDDRPPGYRVIDLRQDGSIATEVVWLEGYRD